MVYDAPLVALSIAGIELFRLIGLWLEGRIPSSACGLWLERKVLPAGDLSPFEKITGKKFPLWLHWYTWYYAFMFSLGFWAIVSSMSQLQSASWLEPNAVEAYANITLAADEAAEHAEFNQSSYVAWKEEASLEGYQMLRLFSLLSPLWLIGTFVVSVLHVRKHVAAVQRSGGLKDSPLRDKTLRILGLPMCYGLMSFKSVVRMWQLCVDAISEGDPNGFHYFTSYTSRREFVMEMYESNFMVGDIYEAYALAIFGHLLIEVLDRKFNLVDQEGPRSSTADGPSNSQADQDEHEEDSSNLVDQEDSSNTLAARRQKSMGSLTIAGIMLFFYTCTIQAVYNLTVTFMGFWGILDTYFSRDPVDHSVFQSEHMKESAKYFFLGAGFMASFAAIGNIMQVEDAFHDLLKEFAPAPKFWGTKILVSLAFLQSCALAVIPPFNEWSAVRANLLYASCLTLECFLISLSHLFAWSHEEKWYAENENEPLPDSEHQADRSGEGEESQVLTQMETHEPVQSSMDGDECEFSPLSIMSPRGEDTDQQRVEHSTMSE